ncbi:MAG: hypothetical protein AAFN00_18290 [Cyanobacteria bacterium J06558_2]
MEKTNQRYIETLKEKAIADNIISRDETQTILSQLQSNTSKKAILVTGEAGIGKSVVMLQVSKELIDRGIPILSMRVDNLRPAKHPDDVGKQLKLPGSPTNVLASIAQDRECVLIIDQLDVVSLASGRHLNFFECVYEIIKQTLVYPKMSLLLACRKFDLENDPRLKQLTDTKGIAETININSFSHNKVKEIVTKLNLDATKLNPRQLYLLSVPLHLWLLSQIASDSTSNSLDFITAKDLYDNFWNYKLRILKAKLRTKIKWTKVIDLICDRMSDKQSLSVPKTIIDDYQTDAEAMASEHVLVEDNNRYRFFHDSFFDYAFARRFAAREEDLLALLRSDEQHLFRRTQVKQILIHEREGNSEFYLEHLEELLISNNIRFHIKQIIFAWLGTLNDPKEEEWEIILPMLEGDDSLNRLAWSAICTSSSWFKLLESLGLVTQWLNSSQTKDVNRAIYLLWNAQKETPEIVASLLNSLNKGQELTNKIIDRTNLGHNRQIFDLFLNLLNHGYCDGKKGVIDHTGSDFWSQIYSLQKNNSDWACEAIGHYLDRYLKLSIAIGQDNLFDSKNSVFPHSQSAESVIRASANRSPGSFIKYILPFVLKQIKLTVNSSSSNPPLKDDVWYYIKYGNYYDFEDILLNCLEKALQDHAIKNPQDCKVIIEQQLKPNQDFKTIQFLIIRTYTANGAYFSNDAINFLYQDPIRLETGYHICNGNTYAASYWATRELLINVIPYCSASDLNRLSNTLFNYYPIWNKRKQKSIFLTTHLYDSVFFPNRYPKCLVLKLFPQTLNLLYWLSCSQYLESLKISVEHSLYLRGYPQFILIDSFVIAAESQLQIIATKIFTLAYSSNTRYHKITYLILLNNIQLFAFDLTIAYRWMEWRRKFKSSELTIKLAAIEPPEAIEASFVDSPISQDITSHMTDEQWLKAINKYNADGINSRKTDLTKGGALELSRNLEKSAATEPVRFANLIWKLSDTCNSCYFNAILNGLANSKINIPIKFWTILIDIDCLAGLIFLYSFTNAVTASSVIQRCYQLPDKPCGRAISNLFQKLASLPWSIGAMNILICYALNDPDPEKEFWRKTEPNDTIYYGGNILTAGINSVRGSAVEAIASLIFADKTRGAYFQYPLEQIVRDKSIAVRSCAAEALTAILNYDRDLAVRLFLGLCDTESILLGVNTVKRFLKYATYTHFDIFKPLLEEMIHSQETEIVANGAMISCMRALGMNEAQDLANYCLSASITHRKTLAQVFVANFKSANFRQYCVDGLIKLFNDPEEDVRSQAARCFYELENDELKVYTDLVQKFVSSSAFNSESDTLIHALTKTSAKLPEATYLVCDRFVKHLKTLAPEQMYYIRDGDRISQLLINLYSQSNKTMKSKCLDLIDILSEINLHQLNQAVSNYER